MNEQREILFRGKRTDNGEWAYGYYTEECAFCQGNVIETKNADYNVDRATVGQYTGLKDKNGQRIFEGDILHFINTYRGANTEWHCVVEFRYGDFVCRDIERHADYGEVTYNHFDSWNYPAVQWDVIGNIHDNSELLDAQHGGERRNGTE